MIAAIQNILKGRIAESLFLLTVHQAGVRFLLQFNDFLQKMQFR